MIMKIHKTADGKQIVAVCDSELVGKSYTEDKKQLDLTSEFYNGEEVYEKDIIKTINNAYIVNFVGKKSIELGKKLGIINEGNVIFVQKIPHAQAVLF